MAFCERCNRYIQTPYIGLCQKCAFKLYSINCKLCETPNNPKFNYICSNCYEKFSFLFDNKKLPINTDKFCNIDIYCKDCRLLIPYSPFKKRKFCINCLHRIFNDKCAYCEKLPSEKKLYVHICQSCYNKIINYIKTNKNK